MEEVKAVMKNIMKIIMKSTGVMSTIKMLPGPVKFDLVRVFT
jgi:hypothetical protein